MAGGNWTVQNKVRPGVYVRFAGEGQPVGTIGERGVTALALELPWGPAKTLLEIRAEDDVRTLLGYDLTDASLLLVKEALKRSRTLLLYRLNAGTQATATLGNLTATAKHGGVRGNDLSVAIQVNVDDAAKFDVATLLDGVVVNTQIAAVVADLSANDWVSFSGTGSLAATAGVPLTGGANGTAANGDHAGFLAALELRDYHTVAYAGTDATLKGVYAAFVRRQREDEGKKVQGIMADYPVADHEGIISVKNGVVLADGATLTAAQATAWVAAATAAAGVNESLTYANYDDAVDASPRYTNSQTEAALLAGEVVFTAGNGRAYVEQDVNTLKSVSADKPASLRKNRVIRVLDSVSNDCKRIFEASYVGKISNNADGRGLFQASVVSYLESLQRLGAIQNFNARTDAAVTAGTDADSILIDANIQPVDSVDKIYMRVNVR
ncbi:phage tail sheath family protein [Cohnella panacarvi]|uniref:phage tail sheath family protein n=1 Tax=Cohnella panacarvi TaxID=400776 RepID=UPI00047D2C14|nr:phage tail sheath family protein [Cohnella panacarvi]